MSPTRAPAPCPTHPARPHPGVRPRAPPPPHPPPLPGPFPGPGGPGPRPPPLLPLLPPFAEAGFPGYEVPLGWGLAPPAGTPRAIIARLNQALDAALRSEEVRQRLALEGAEPTPTTPEEYAAIIDRELTMWSALARTVGIKPE